MVLMVIFGKDPFRRVGRRRRGTDPARTDPDGVERAPRVDSATDVASDLESRHPGWVILWRCWAHRYWAFPLWITDIPEPIESRNVQDLLTQMNHIELHDSSPRAIPAPRTGDREHRSPVTRLSTSRGNR